MFSGSAHALNEGRNGQHRDLIHGRLIEPGLGLHDEKKVDRCEAMDLILRAAQKNRH